MYMIQCIYSTQTLAHEVAEGAMAEGYDVGMFYLHEDERSENSKSILTSKAVHLEIQQLTIIHSQVWETFFYFKRTSFQTELDLG